MNAVKTNNSYSRFTLTEALRPSDYDPKDPCGVFNQSDNTTNSNKKFFVKSVSIGDQTKSTVNYKKPEIISKFLYAMNSVKEQKATPDQKALVKTLTKANDPPLTREQAIERKRFNQAEKRRRKRLRKKIRKQLEKMLLKAQAEQDIMDVDPPIPKFERQETKTHDQVQADIKQEQIKNKEAMNITFGNFYTSCPRTNAHISEKVAETALADPIIQKQTQAPTTFNPTFKLKGVDEHGSPLLQSKSLHTSPSSITHHDTPLPSPKKARPTLSRSRSHSFNLASIKQRLPLSPMSSDDEESMSDFSLDNESNYILHPDGHTSLYDFDNDTNYHYEDGTFDCGYCTTIDKYADEMTQPVLDFCYYCKSLHLCATQTESNVFICGECLENSKKTTT
jgi:hypothetical protein